MTYNALGVKVKGTDETLAEKLEIEMPEADAPTELKVEDVYTENLKEVVVELNNAELVNEESATNVNRYRMIDNKIASVKLVENKIIVELEKAMVADRSYEFIVRDLHKNANKQYTVKAKDNAAPKVLGVESLGEHGIRVTTSEPIKNALERNFLIDGKNVTMIIEQYGRELVLIPYYNQKFPTDAKELTIKALEDYAGFKLEEDKWELNLETDKVGPEVLDVIVEGQDVIVKFDKDVYSRSVSYYTSKRSEGNISYNEGRLTIRSTDAKKIDTDTVKYTFGGKLPRNVESIDFTIEGVKNHSDVAMEKTVRNGRAILDYSEPIIIDDYVAGWTIVYNADGKTADANVEIQFDKDVTGLFENNSTNVFKTSEHIRLYESEYLNRNDVSAAKIVSVKYDVDRKDVIVVEMKDLVINSLANNYEFEYILEVENFRDTTSVGNRMYRDYVDFEIGPKGTAFTVANKRDAANKVIAGQYVDLITKFYIDEKGKELVVNFNHSIDKALAEDARNYMFIDALGRRRDLAELGGEAIAETNGTTVSLFVPRFDLRKNDTLELLPTLKNRFGARLTGPRFNDLRTNKWEDRDYTPAPIAKVVTYSNTDGNIDADKALNLDVVGSGNVITVALDGKVGDKAQVKLLDQDGNIVTLGTPANLTVAVAGTPVTSAVTVPNTLLDRGIYTIEVTRGIEVLSKLIVNILDTNTAGTIKYLNDGVIVSLPGTPPLAETLSYGTNLASLTASDFEVTAANATSEIEFASNGKQVIVTITAENGTVAVYTISLDVQEITAAVTTAPVAGSTITVTVNDQNTDPIKGIEAAKFSVKSGPAGTLVANAVTNVVDNGNGTYTLTLTTPLITGDVVVTTVGTVAAAQTAAVL